MKRACMSADWFSGLKAGPWRYRQMDHKAATRLPSAPSVSSCRVCACVPVSACVCRTCVLARGKLTTASGPSPLLLPCVLHPCPPSVKSCIFSICSRRGLFSQLCPNGPSPHLFTPFYLHLCVISASVRMGSLMR